MGESGFMELADRVKGIREQIVLLCGEFPVRARWEKMILLRAAAVMEVAEEILRKRDI